MHSGWTEVPETEIWAAADAEAEWMVDLLDRLVRAPTVLGNEEPGQAVMEAAFQEIGLHPTSIALDPDTIRADAHHSPFSWDVADKRMWRRRGLPAARADAR
jgi:acetylornithine deacetylase